MQTSGVIEFALWVKANWGTISMTVLGIIGAASLFIKSLEKLVAALVKVFPGLQKEDGELKHIAAWLDGLSHASFLNTLALSPEPTPAQVITAPVPPAATKAAGTAHLGLLALVAIGTAALLTGCKHMTPLESRLLSCGQSAIASNIQGLVPSVENALTQQSSANTSAALDQLLMTGGDAAVCAVEAVVASLEGQVSGTSVAFAMAGQVPPSVQLIRAQSWLSACQWHNGYRVSP